MYILNVESSENIYWDNINHFINSNKLSLALTISSGYIPSSDIIPGHVQKRFTIPEWLRLIRDSKYFITTSFHGVVFAVIFRTPFLAIPLKGKFSKSNNRIESFLARINLKSRIYSVDRGSFDEQINAPINWDQVMTKLEELKQESFDFLENMNTQ